MTSFSMMVGDGGGAAASASVGGNGGSTSPFGRQRKERVPVFGLRHGGRPGGGWRANAEVMREECG